MTEERSSHRLVVDRREGEYVVVALEEGATLDLPRWLVPPEAREGDVMIARVARGPSGDWRVDWRVDSAATAAARKAAREKLERLLEGDPGGDVLL